ncbi:MAG: NUDIX hydrolase, partial [Candidatus Riflebacteria bacterium]|nr:NUDIX hydrolase [Candidatus Riflebacteria bacterium]
MVYEYEYPRPSVTLDAAVLRTPALEYPEILLIKRGNDPFLGFWALPGGFMEMDETPLFGASRELAEETGLTDLPLKPLFACGEPGRDPRGRTVTFVFGCLIRDTNIKPKSGDDAAEVAWFPLNKLPKMAFDHKTVIAQIEQGLLWQAKHLIIGQDV